MPDQKWFDEQPIEQLHQIAATNANSPLGKMAQTAIQKKEAERARQEAARLEQIESQRHQEAVVLDRQAIGESQRANRLSVRAIGLAVLALIVSGVSLLWQWQDRAASKSKVHFPAVEAPLSNSVIAVLPQVTTNTISITGSPPVELVTP